MLTNQQIAQALKVPQSRVDLYWPLIDQCLSALCGAAYTDSVKIAALATIRVECPPFKPIHEYGTDEQHEKLYAHRMGNVNAGDGAKFAGRGFIQITGAFNYKKYGDLLGVNLVVNPDLALEPNCAATIFAAYFHDKCMVSANAGNFVRVREEVNGGHNGLTAFMLYVEALAEAADLKEIAAMANQQLAAFEA